MTWILPFLFANDVSIERQQGCNTAPEPASLPSWALHTCFCHHRCCHLCRCLISWSSLSSSFTQPVPASPPFAALHTCSAPSRDQPRDDKFALLRYAKCKFWYSKQDFPPLALTFLERLGWLNYSPAQNITMEGFPRKLRSTFPDHDEERPPLKFHWSYSPWQWHHAFWKRIFLPPSKSCFATLFFPHSKSCFFSPHSKSPGTSPCHLEHPVHTGERESFF